MLIRKEYEDCQSFQECVDELIRRAIERVERDVPEVGKFSDIFELFDNPDDSSADVVGKYGLHIYKMQADIVSDPAMRYIQACAYIPSAAYKATLMCGSGNKQEIIAIMKEPAFAERLNNTFAKLLDMLEDL